MSKNIPSFKVKVNTPGKVFFMQGDMFNFRTDNGLFLSSNKFNGTENYYDIYALTKSVSSQNPPFSAYPVYNYRVYTNNVLSFELSAFNEPQKLDIIYANDAGYRLASNSKRFSFIQIVSAYS